MSYSSIGAMNAAQNASVGLGGLIGNMVDVVLVAEKLK